MKRLSKIFVLIIIVTITFVSIRHYFLYIREPYTNKIIKPSLDKSCEFDSDCVIGRAELCGYTCTPSNTDVYNKKTIDEIRKWKATFKSRACPIAECPYIVGSPINYFPKCVNKQCTIEKSINCESKSPIIRLGICEMNDTHTINFIEKELQTSIDEIKRLCNCPS